MTQSTPPPSLGAKLRRKVTLRKAFTGYMAVALAASVALSFATLFALSRAQQTIYDDSYNGTYTYLYDPANQALVPAKTINISLDEESFLPVCIPVSDGGQDATPISDIRSMDGPVTIYGANSHFFSDGENSATDSTGSSVELFPWDPEETRSAMKSYYQHDWEQFVAALKADPDGLAARGYTAALGAMPETAAQAQQLFQEKFGPLAAPFDYFPTSMYTGADIDLRNHLEKGAYVLVVLWFALCFAAAANLFYRRRLAKPVALLEGAADSIAQQDLDFSVAYGRHDEMGKLTESFETMRQSLEQSQRQLWQTAEDRKRLNTAFAHDLRTPLVVLQGRLEILAQRADSGTLQPEELVSTCATLLAQVQRLESYVETMSTLQRLDDRPVNRASVSIAALMSELQAMGDELAKEGPARVTVIASPRCPLLASDEGRRRAVASIDLPLVLEVAENLVTNGLRHANGQVTVEVEVTADGPLLKLRVEDDGPGFSAEALAHGREPFFSEGEGPGHFGAGLSIADMLCQKHDGCLALANRPAGGARATATFATA